MINEKSIEKIKLTITQIYQKIITKKSDKIVAWQGINLLCLLSLIFNFLLTIFNFVAAYNLHFTIQKAVFLPLGIVFLLITLVNFIFLIFIRKRQKRLINQLKINLNKTLLINTYNDIFKTIFKTLTITDISSQWTIKPVNLPHLSDFKVNDNIIIGQYHGYNFNFGSINQATTTVVDNLQPNLISKPYNLQYYRYLFLTITSPSLNDRNFEITRKNKYQKNNLTFNNFFWYDQTNAHLTLPLKNRILENMKTTKMIPNIKVTKQTCSLQLATSSINNSKDNYNSLLNIKISLNKKIMVKNILLMLNHDYEILQKGFVWFNLIVKKD
ncbi:hypothetical protein M1770_03660 [Spiroplasma citri]|uniref:hypothetical protein n=1 Tax=Spiroplasma citri TaxID=2133 RepID=UPI0024125CD3|nr:hypothetical protein [Spiroplasma citri]WFG99063.1 hypothetical protein M1770_03660 [Spiroplasma citri]